MTTLAEKKADAAEAEETTPARAVVVQPGCVWQNKAGSRFCQWDVRAPEGATFDDLLDPSAWKRTQEIKRPAIRQDDEVRIVAFDRSWAVWCFVSHATGNGIILSQFADTKPAGPREHLFADDRYTVRFVGSGYSVFRKTDGQKMSDVWPSAALAQTALLNLYPKQVA